MPGCVTELPASSKAELQIPMSRIASGSPEGRVPWGSPPRQGFRVLVVGEGIPLEEPLVCWRQPPKYGGDYLFACLLWNLCIFPLILEENQAVPCLHVTWLRTNSLCDFSFTGERRIQEKARP